MQLGFARLPLGPWPRAAWRGDLTGADPAVELQPDFKRPATMNQLGRVARDLDVRPTIA